nr:hypothetical protein [Tanacetum cinerariifolium]
MTPPPDFSARPKIPNINTSERPPVTTTMFVISTIENTTFAYRASTSANLNPMISPTFVEANYKVLESLLRELRRKIRNEDVRTELEYFSEDYDEEQKMEPRPGPTRETTPPFDQGLLWPSEIETRENGNRRMNLPPLLAAHLGKNESGQPLQYSLTSVCRGHKPRTNTGGNLPLMQKKFSKMHLAVHNIKQREGESTRAFATRYTDDTLQILGLREDQRISGFVHDLRTRSLVEHLSTDLPSTYKGLMEKTYTWIEVREVATNEAPSDRRENFERLKKSSWDNNRGQKGRDRFSSY